MKPFLGNTAFGHAPVEGHTDSSPRGTAAALSAGWVFSGT